MKPTHIRILQTIALAAGLAVSASTALGAGRLGQRHVEATLDTVLWDDDSGLEDALGASLTFNQPLAPNFDLSLGYSHLRSDIEDIDDGEGGEIDGGDLTGDLVFFSGTWFTPAANGRLYARGAVGWANTDSPLGEDSTWAWMAETGLEIPLGSSAAVTPFISYTDAFEGGADGVFDFGVTGEIDLGSSASLLLSASINDDSDVGLSGGVVFRF